jgi:hypothetical protein
MAERWWAGAALSYGIGGERQLRDPDASSSLLPLRPNDHFPSAMVLVYCWRRGRQLYCKRAICRQAQEHAALRGCRGIGIDHQRGLPHANIINARGARREPLETVEFRAVSLPGGLGEDKRRRARTRAAVRADPSLSHIWVGNGSNGPHLSICIGPLGCVFPHFLSTRTRSDARWSNESARDTSILHHYFVS